MSAKKQLASFARYYGRVLKQIVADIWRLGKQQMIIGALAAILIVALQIYYGMIPKEFKLSSVLAIIYPYLVIVAGALVFHAARAPWVLDEIRRKEVATEKARRLELELELQKIQQGSSSVFNNQENSEFQYIYQKLNRNLEFGGTMYEATFTENAGKRVKNFPGRRAAEYSISIPLVPLLASFVRVYDRYDNWALDRFLYQDKNIRQHAAVLPANDLQNFSCRTPDLTQELYAYEFLERSVEERRANDKRYVYFFTPKTHRFLFWADYNKLVDENYPIEILRNKEVSGAVNPVAVPTGESS
jgi:hypothetical protein